MERMNRLKYTGIAVCVGLAVVLFGSGAYANTKQHEKEESEQESETITLDIFETTNEEQSENSSTDLDDTGWQAAGAGEVFDDTRQDETHCSLKRTRNLKMRQQRQNRKRLHCRKQATVLLQSQVTTSLRKQAIPHRQSRKNL